MKKRIKSIIMAVLTLISVLAVCDADMKTVYAEGDTITVTFHYSRPDGIYDREHFSLYIWSDAGGAGAKFFDENGTTTFEVSKETTQIGFYVKDVQASKAASAEGTAGIIKDTGEDRYVDLLNLANDTLDVYLKADVAAFTTSMEEEQPSEEQSSDSSSVDVTQEVTEVSSDDPNADYSASTATVVIVDIVIIAAVAAISYVVYSKQKNPITGMK